MEQIVSQLMSSLDNFHYLLYGLAFCAALFETALLIGLILPGSTMLLFLGAYSAGGNLNFTALWGFAVIGAILGDNLNYYLGKRFGNQWVKKGWWFLKAKHVDHTRHFLDAHGAKSIFLGRFVPSMKELMPFLAGSVRMRQRTFIFWNILGALGWGLEWLGAGYLFAKSLNIAQLWIPRVGLILLVVIFIYILLWGLQRLTINYGQVVFSFIASLWRSISEAIINNEEVQHLLRTYPRFFNIIKQRIDRTHFYGLTLSLLSLTFLYVLILFGGIVEDIVTSDPIIYLDKHIAQLVTIFRTPDVLQFFIWVTNLGNVYFVLPFATAICVLLALVGRAWLIIPLLTSLFASAGFTLLGKLAFQRTRPIEAVLQENSYSFPSGHGTLAMGFYGFLLYLLIRYATTWKIRIRLFFAGTVLISLLGLSRIILDVHYLSDVLGGFLVGTLWLIIAISLTEWLVSLGYVSFNRSTTQKRRWLFSTLSCLFIMYFVGFAIGYHPDMAPAKAAVKIDLNEPLTNYLTNNRLQYTHTLLGQQSQPLGIAIVAEDDMTLLAQLKQAGWQSAHHFNLHQLWQQILKPDSISNTGLAPVFWHGQINDYAFILPEQNAKFVQETTLRVWKTVYRIEGKPLYLAVSRDYDDTFWRIFHSVNADIDTSKNTFISSLQQQKVVKHSCILKFVKPMTGKYFLGDHFFTQGKLLLVNLSTIPIKSDSFCSK